MGTRQWPDYGDAPGDRDPRADGRTQRAAFNRAWSIAEEQGRGYDYDLPADPSWATADPSWAEPDRRARERPPARKPRGRWAVWLVSVLATVLAAALVMTGVYVGLTKLERHNQLSAAVMQAPENDVGIVTSNLSGFDQSCGCRPNVGVAYIDVGTPVYDTVPHQMLTLGATPLLEILPTNTTLAEIIAGKDDAWLNSFAQMVRGQRAGILMSFAPEANGNWYSWAITKSTPAAQEIAAWRHVVTLFRAAGATNASWVWIVNKSYPGSTPLSSMWPGAAYVDEVGIDTYFRTSTDTFATIALPTLDEIHQFTTEPVLISETGANSVAGKARALQSLISGVAQYGVNGFIWFDINQPGQTLHEPKNFAIDGDQSAMALYKSAAQPYQRPATAGT